MTDSSGAILNTYEYTAFGDIASQTGTTPNVYLYTGQRFDATTAQYSLRAREYDPAVGRFLSRDTWAVDTWNPVELNRYVYAAANPVTWSDPSGLTTTLEWGSTTIAVVGAGLLLLAAVTPSGCLPYYFVNGIINLMALAGMDTSTIKYTVPRQCPTIDNDDDDDGDNDDDGDDDDGDGDDKKEEDCLEGLTPQAAAAKYAGIARTYWGAGTTAADGKNAPMTIAVTRAKIGNVCKECVAVSYAIGKDASEPYKKRYKMAYAGITALAVLRQAHLIGNPIPSETAGVEGHAERMLYSGLGGNFQAMGISRSPCSVPDGTGSTPCATWLQTIKDLEVAW